MEFDKTRCTKIYELLVIAINMKSCTMDCQLLTYKAEANHLDQLHSSELYPHNIILNILDVLCTFLIL